MKRPMKSKQVRFCWECGRQLYGNKKMLKQIDGEIRTLHIACGQLYPQIPPHVIIKNPWIGKPVKAE